MADIGIIGSGIAGLQLGLGLQQHGITATIYCERTPEQLLACPLPNMVARNGCTRERERQLGVNHWDSPAHDMVRLSVCVRGARPLAFSGRMEAPAHSTDLRMYWARLLEDFSMRGGRVVIGSLRADQIETVASRHDLLVVASGRGSLSTMFPRREEHSPHTRPQRLCVFALFRGIRQSDPCALEVIVTPGSGEILAAPMQSFEPDVTGIGILITTGGLFEPLRHLRHDADPRGFVSTVLAMLHEHAPTLHERVDPRVFDVARPLDLGYAAITPAVRQGFVELSNGRFVVALGDAHVVIDPITGQGANNASHAAEVLCRAIRAASGFDRSFCERAEGEIASYVLPVSDAANARLQPPQPHFRDLLAAAARDGAVADMYADGYNHPDQFWATASSPERTAAFLRDVTGRGTSSLEAV